MKFRFLFYFVFSLLLLNGCDLFNQLKTRVEVNYDIDFDAIEGETATVTYYNNKSELIEEDIVPGEWSYKAVFNEGDKTGFWLETDCQKGYISMYHIIWYSELNDLEDYVWSNTWALPQTIKMGNELNVSMTKCYPVVYSVNVSGTNGIPVDIQFSDADYESGSLLKEALQLDGEWKYEACFPEGAYASVTASSEATSGTAVITITIDYDDKADKTETMTVDFSTATKSGSLGFPVE